MPTEIFWIKYSQMMLQIIVGVQYVRILLGVFSPDEQAEYERILDEQYKDTGINIDELI